MSNVGSIEYIEYADTINGLRSVLMNEQLDTNKL